MNSGSLQQQPPKSDITIPQYGDQRINFTQNKVFIQHPILQILITLLNAFFHLLHIFISENLHILGFQSVLQG
jgi:hypothetical protein